MISKIKSKKSRVTGAILLGLALVMSAPAFSEVTRVSELVDVDPNVWAYKSLKELVEKYDVLEGYPDKTFKGSKPATRYEMAQALYEVLKVVDLNDADPETASTIARLKKELDRELAEVRSQIASLEGRVDALEAANSLDVPSWTDRIKISGDLVSVYQLDNRDNDNDPFARSEDRDFANTWGTIARIGIDAVILADDQRPGSILGEGIAHIMAQGGNGGQGTFGFPTAGNNLNDIFTDGSNNYGFGNNSLYSGRVQDTRSNLYLQNAYYTQVFKFSKADKCSNEVTDYPNFFAVLDIGQQDLWNTFHKNIVKEDSRDGFLNTRVLHGMVGGSDGATEAIHLGLNWLGDSTETERTDECGNTVGGGVGTCGEPLPGFFQALSVDLSYAAIKTFGDDEEIPVNFFGDTGFGQSSDRVQDNYSLNAAVNFLHDIPGEFFDKGLFTLGWSGTRVTLNNALVPAGGAIDNFGNTIWFNAEQWFGRNRTVGTFFNYAHSFDQSSNAFVNGPFRDLWQGGVVVNTNFFPEKWNFNKDQFGVAYSYAIPHNVNSNGGDPREVSALFASLSQFPTTSTGFAPQFYGDDSDGEHILEMYYRKYLTENISFIPDLQVIYQGNGREDAVDWSLSARLNVKLPNWNDGGAFDQFGYRDWSQRIEKYKAAHSQFDDGQAI